MKCVIYKKKKILVYIKLRMWAWVFKNQSGNYLYQGKADKWNKNILLQG